MPKVDYTDALMYVDWNSGISVSENDRRISNVLREYHKDLITSTSMAGTQDFLLFHTKDITSSEALVYLKCASTEKLENMQEEIKKELLEKYPEATVSYTP